MASLFRSWGLASIAGVSFAVVVGCSNEKPSPPAVESHAEHEEHAMPESFADAVEELKEHAPEIQAAFEADKPQDAHEALHFLGELSVKMVELIDASDLTDEQKTQAKEASEVLFDQDLRLDTEVLHDGSKELKYADVSNKIDESLAKLEALVPAK